MGFFDLDRRALNVEVEQKSTFGTDAEDAPAKRR